MSMITATVWVPRGFAARFPTKYDIDENEFARISKLAKLQLGDAQEELQRAQVSENGQVRIDDESEAAEDGVKLPQSNG